MPAVDTVLLPLCVGLSLLGIIITAFAWRRGNRGRVVQGVGLALAPVALYFSGLLRLLWNGVVAVGNWVTAMILSPTVWFGLSLLGLCVVLWVVGGLVARRSKGRKAAAVPASGRTAALPATSSRTPAKAPAKTPVKPAAKGKAAPPVDDDMAEIEALLRSRGIE